MDIVTLSTAIAYMKSHGGTGGMTIKVASALPESGESGYLYMIKVSGTSTDSYDEYIWENGAWTKIGNSAIDFSDYYTKTEIDTNKQNKLIAGNNITISGDTISTNGYNFSDGLVVDGENVKIDYDSLENQIDTDFGGIVAKESAKKNEIAIWSNNTNTLKTSGKKLDDYYTATEVDTQLTGKLTSPSGAVVGRTLKVATVNDDGTFTCEWAEDNRFELIETITISDDTTVSITRTAEPSGKAYKFKKLYIYGVNLRASGSGRVIGYCNGVQAGYAPSAFSTTNSGIYFMGFDCEHGLLTCQSYGSSNSASNIGVSQVYMGPYITPEIYSDYITRISIQSSIEFPQGSTIKIYGLRA